MNSIVKDPLPRKLEIANWVIFGIMITVSLIFTSSYFTLGILLGGLISILNFYWRQRDLTRVFSQMVSLKAKSSVMFRYYIRFAVTAILLFFIIARTPADVIGLLVGLSIVVINIVIQTILMACSKKKSLRRFDPV
ncbi:MAG: ATP synthase subunit I [Syntrophales bacterium]